jgi:hypothetical protein
LIAVKEVCRPIATLFSGTVLEENYEMKLSVLDNLSDFERERLLRDVGLAEADLRGLFAGRKGAEVLLPQRLQHAGLDPEAIRAEHGGVMRDLERVCSVCQEQKRCTKDLAAHDDARVESYCPNTLTIDSLTAH